MKCEIGVFVNIDFMSLGFKLQHEVSGFWDIAQILYNSVKF